MKKKSTWKIIAVITAIVGALVAVAGYLKVKSKKLSDELDFDDSMFFEDDPTMEYDEDDAGEEEAEEEPAEAAAPADPDEDEDETEGGISL